MSIGNLDVRLGEIGHLDEKNVRTDCCGCIMNSCCDILELLSYLAGYDRGERTNVLCEISVCLDPKLYCGAVHTVWMKLVLETEVNCEKISLEVLLCTREVQEVKRTLQRVIIVSEHVQFVTLHHQLHSPLLCDVGQHFYSFALEPYVIVSLLPGRHSVTWT